MSGSTLPPGNPPSVLGMTSENLDIVNQLVSYQREADNNRKSGMNPRDDKWSQNLDLYYNRVNFEGKLDWQAKETMPEVPGYVDRFTGALKEALVSVPEGFYTVIDPFDAENDITPAIKRMNDVWLSEAGMTPTGQTLAFPSVFEDLCKQGALTNVAATVTWKEDVPGGRVSMEAVDPRFIWLDHTGRNLYRVRRTEIDKIDLLHMLKMTSSKGNPIFNTDEIERLVNSTAMEERMWREQMSGTGQEITSNRKPIVLDEYIATVMDREGNLVGEEHSLYVVAGEKYLVRGPEHNPFWHEKDWLVYSPLITTPHSPYGRTYMEDFGSVAKTFNELTNLLIDAVHTTSINAFAIVPSMLVNPGQAAEGISPNKTFLLMDGYTADEFAQNLELGKLDKGGIEMWQALKNEISEAAGINEIGMGQFAPNSRTSATEVNETQQSSSAMIRSVAQTLETRVLDPMLDLGWKTGMQHIDFSNPRIVQALGPEMAAMFKARRREFVTRPFTFQARGITTMIQRSKVMNNLIQLLQIVGQNEALVQAFMQKIDVGRLMDMLFNLSGIDPSKLAVTQREAMTRSVISPVQEQVAGAPAATPQAAGQIGDIVSRMGIGK